MHLASRLFLISIFFVNTLVFSPQLLDYFLASRFLSASVFCLVFSAFLLVAGSSKKPLSLGIPDLVIVMFVLWNVITIGWVHNLGEAVFTSQRWILFGSVYFLLRISYQQLRGDFLNQLAKLSLWLSIIILLVVTYHFIVLVSEDGFTNKALYGLKAMFGHKSLISAYLLILLPLNILMIQDESPMRRNLILLVAVFQLAMILLLQSRTVYVSTAIFLGILSIYFIRRYGSIPQYRRWFAGASLGLALAVTLILLLNPGLRERLNPLNYAESQTAMERRFVWYKTMPLIRVYLWLGLGTGNWKIHFPKHGVAGAYRLQDQDVIFTRAHNDYLETIAELGVAGIVLYLSMLLLPLIALVLRRSSTDAWQANLMLAGISAFAVSSIFDFPKERIESLIILAIYLVIIRDHFAWKNAALRTRLHFPIKAVVFVLVVFNLMGVMNGYNRYRGESITREILTARQAQRWDRVIALADQAYNRFYSLDPAAVPLFFYKGIALYNLEKMSESEAAFQTARSDNPYNFHVINNLATTYVRTQRFTEALELYDYALEINPRFEEALFNSAFCLYSLNRPEKALEKVMQIPKDSERKRVFIEQITKALETTENN